MNLPNKLTLARALLIVPVAVLTLLAGSRGAWQLWLTSGLCFAAAAVTDIFDGAIARSRGIVTDFGKLMDPVADKLLVTTVLVCFLAKGLCPAWVLIVVLAREFMVTSIRSVAAGKGTVIPANAWGKIKTILQMTAIGVTYTGEFFCGLPFGTAKYLGAVRTAELVLFVIAAAATIVSGIIYMVQSREFFKDVK